MTRPQIAVVVTCYNLGRFVEEAVLSVVRQTLPPAELLIVDDGSTDGHTQQALARLEKGGHRVVRTPNAGVSTARNLGIRETAAPYLVLLDADDLLDGTYLEKASARLEEHPELAFVSSGMRCFGAADEVWIPPRPDLIESMTRGVVHISSMFRRAMWAGIGGFDEEFPAYEDVDFWTTALERGFRGEVLPEPLLLYRVRPRSTSHSAVRRATHLRLMERFYRKHLGTLGNQFEALLLAKERFILEQRAHHEYLQGRRQQLTAELARLHHDIDEAVRELRSFGHDRVEFGDLRRTVPISPVWGMDRGGPLDRYYIHSFLGRHRADVHGRVLEVKDPGYARMFGDDRVDVVDVVDVDADNEQATIVVDLARADAIPSDSYDCFILTQTLGLIYHAASAVAHACRVLKPGGVLLCTVPASGRISYEAQGLDGDYWRFTEAAVRRMFAEVFSPDAFEITGFGNVLACSGFLYGLAPAELSPAELDAVDPFFPVVYGIRAVKPLSPAVRRVQRAIPGDHRRSVSSASGAILMYHRIAEPQLDPHGLCVSARDFRAHLQHVKDAGYEVLPLRDLARSADRGEMPERGVAITFDDGYLDALTCASAILSEFSFPATFFIVGSALDPDYEFWWDALDRVFLFDHPIPPMLDVNLPDGRLDLPTSNTQERRLAHARLTEACYVLPRSTRDDAIRVVVNWSTVGRRPEDAARPMTPEELISLANARGVTIGAHGENHVWLPSQPEDDRQREIVASKDRLERLLRRPITSFSYPYGGHDDGTVDLVRRAGFEEAVTTEERPVTCGTHPLWLPRYDVSRWGGDSFADRLRRVFDGTVREG
jgi:peptidoglycan/xylan/chitin deacetylase (PgdA/CDA1 family)/glycosyltransferase involved in cell wall biosynthesis/SAM-dependent methyltransferase